ncbi:MAG: VUT family protein [Thermomicrobiales bacterium]|nr:VUT family protein [Thermomicrobiales bacterium]
MTLHRRLAVALLALGYIGTIFAANWAIAVFGAVPVGFGLLAPAGVWFAGIAFTLRDLLHDAAGRGPVLAAIVAGALCSMLVSPAFALASGVAFLLSELADLAVYSPLRERTWLGAVALSNSVGLLVDSALFLWLAFGSLEFLSGQVVGKAWMTALAIVLLLLARKLLGGADRDADWSPFSRTSAAR